MNLIATVFARHLGELELMTALPQMQARLQSLGLPVSEDAMQVWEACRATYTAAERLHGSVATLEELEAENVAMRAERDDLRAKITAATEQARALDAEADRIRAEIAKIEAETAKARAELDRNRARIAELQALHDPYKRAAALVVQYGIRRRSTEPETPKNHAPHQEN